MLFLRCFAYKFRQKRIGMALRILIADDHRIFRKGLRNVISTFDNMEVVGEAINGAEALYLTDAEKPDILLLDINMPILNGIEVLEEMAKRNLSTKALMISMHEDSMHMLKCLKAGACGYLSKDAEPAEIEKAIRQIASNGMYYNDAINNALRNQLIQNDSTTILNSNELNDKEVTILQYMAEGLSNQDIASKTLSSVRTVENIRYGLMKKFGVNNGISLLIQAIKMKVVTIL